MLVSTRGRYALRITVELARRGEGALVPLKELSEAQEISLKYLEGIVAALSKAGLVVAAPGKRGGYKLARDPRSISVLEVLNATEGDVAAVACLRDDSDVCPRRDSCSTLPLWSKLNELILDCLGGVTLHELASGKI